MKIQPNTQRSLKYDQIAERIKCGTEEEKKAALNLYMRKLHGHIVFHIQPSLKKIDPLHADEIAKDLAQETIINVLKGIKNFDWGSGKFSTWVFAIAKNVLIDYLRRANRQNDYSQRYIKETAWAFSMDYGKKADEDVKRKKYARLIQAALRYSCAPLDKNCFLDIYWHGMSYEDVARERGLKLNTLKSIVLRTKRNMKAFLDTNFPNCYWES